MTSKRISQTFFFFIPKEFTDSPPPHKPSLTSDILIPQVHCISAIALYLWFIFTGTGGVFYCPQSHFSLLWGSSLKDAHSSQTLFYNRQSNLRQKAGKKMLMIPRGLIKYHHVLHKDQQEISYIAMVP